MAVRMLGGLGVSHYATGASPLCEDGLENRKTSKFCAARVHDFVNSKRSKEPISSPGELDGGQLQVGALNLL